jgi:hypothetical protein
MTSAIEALREEAGYAAAEVELESLGAVWPSKSVDTGSTSRPWTLMASHSMKSLGMAVNMRVARLANR